MLYVPTEGMKMAPEEAAHNKELVQRLESMSHRIHCVCVSVHVCMCVCTGMHVCMYACRHVCMCGCGCMCD